MELVSHQLFLGPFQVCVQNEWHRVVDSSWTMEDAMVACRQLELQYEGLLQTELKALCIVKICTLKCTCILLY